MAGEYDDRDLFDDEHPGPQVLESALANTALSEVVSQPALIVTPSTTLADTIHLMQRERRACVLVMEDDHLAGIFTERDILMKVAGQPLDLVHTPGRRQRGVRAEQDGARGLPPHPVGRRRGPSDGGSLDAQSHRVPRRNLFSRVADDAARTASASVQKSRRRLIAPSLARSLDAARLPALIPHSDAVATLSSADAARLLWLGAVGMQRQQTPDTRRAGQSRVERGAESVSAALRPDSQPGRDRQGLRPSGGDCSDPGGRSAREGDSDATAGGRPVEPAGVSRVRAKPGAD